MRKPIKWNIHITRSAAIFFLGSLVFANCAFAQAGAAVHSVTGNAGNSASAFGTNRAERIGEGNSITDPGDHHKRGYHQSHRAGARSIRWKYLKHGENAVLGQVILARSDPTGA